MANRNDFDDFFGDDEEAPVTDTRADGRLYRVPLNRVSPNLVNPRTDFGTDDQLIDLGKSLARRQNQPCPVVSRNAYLKLWPEHGDRIKDVDYILVSGERRYRGASIVGLPALNCVANDDFATDRKTFMEAVVSENVDRQNFDPVEEAYAVQALVAEFGSNRAVAQHFERVDGWVTQRVLLTHLAREAQDLVRQKAMPLEAARQLGKLARDKGWSARDQLEWWESEQGRRSAVSAARSAARKAARQDPPEQPAAVAEPAARPAVVEPGFTAVKPEPAQASAQEARFTAVNQPEELEAATSSGHGQEAVRLPEARTEPPAHVPAVEGESSTPRRFPYEDAVSAARHLILKMPTDVLVSTIRMLLEHAQEHDLNVASERAS